MFKGNLKLNLESLERLFEPKSPSLIGCDIASSAVKMVEIAAAGKGLYRVERYAIEPLHMTPWKTAISTISKPSPTA